MFPVGRGPKGPLQPRIRITEPVMAATMSNSTIMATGPYWFLSSRAVPKNPSRVMASTKLLASSNSGGSRLGIRSPLRTSPLMNIPRAFRS